MKKVITLSCFLSLLIFQCKKDKLVFANPVYAIGTIDFYKPADKSSSAISFTYYVNGNAYEYTYGNNDHGWSVPNSGNYKSGDKYMVEYNSGDLNTCRFLFDYPVNDSTDYVNDVTQFKTHPPSCCLIYTYRSF